ncbi:MAG: lysophospholipid acyltransferase family protein [Endomicrobiales bacterium]|nr:lysophospholipid acyltransferase family protein [Endomicrobiales bacterium]
MKKLQREVEYILLQIFGTLLRLLPLSVVRFMARSIGSFAYYCVPIRKKVILTNLRNAFLKEKSEKEIRAIAKANYRQFAVTFMELVCFPKIKKQELLNITRFKGFEHVEKAINDGKGAVLVGAHFCNWEIMGAAIAQRYPLTFVIGQQENSKVDSLLNEYRAEKGIKLIPLKFALRGVMKTLKANELIAILADQDAHEDGVFVEFFGRPASTPKGPAMFALRQNCPMIAGHIFRARDGKFDVEFEVVQKPQAQNQDELIGMYMANFTKILEKNTRKAPDNWFWMHKRWKTKPQLGTKIYS